MGVRMCLMSKPPMTDAELREASSRMLFEALSDLAGPAAATTLLTPTVPFGKRPRDVDAVQFDRLQGSLFGLAIGDALGAPVEFMSRTEILARFGPRGVTGFLPWRDFAPGSWTDDTQMAVATVEGIIDMCAAVDRAREAMTTGEGEVSLPNPVRYVYDRYLAWLATQADPFHRRAPGNTCLAALESGRIGDLDEPINDSKGCGGAMRTPVVGLLIDPPDAFQLGAEFAAITHGHPSGYLSAGLVAEIVGHVREGKALGVAVGLAKKVLKKHKGHEAMLAVLERAQSLAKQDVPPHLAIAQLGEGWVGEEAVAIAVYCALRYPGDFRKAVLAAVNITGDSDSTGAITGAIVGAQVGFQKLPKAWREGVEAKDMLWDLGARFLQAIPQAWA